MDEANSVGLDDDRIAVAARRIIRQYRLQQADRSEGSVDTITRPPPRAPDDVQSLRLAIDTMELAIEQMQRLQVSREAVFMEAVERVERNVSKTAGRVDALAEEITRIASQPAMNIDALLDDQRTAAVGVIEEFGRMMVLSRALLDETAQMHSEALKAIGTSAAVSRPKA